MRFYLIVFIFYSSICYSQDCNQSVNIVFNNVVKSIGNNSIFPPKLNFSSSENSVAYMTSDGVTIEYKAIELFCGSPQFESHIAYIISHELAHYYLRHSWMSNTGLAYSSSIGEFLDDKKYSKEQRKLFETQADLYAGFYGQLAGYNTLDIAPTTLKIIYEEYSLPNHIPGYPSYDERIEIINAKSIVADELATLFEIGNVLLLNQDYKLAKYCFEYILKSDFLSREIYNNLGLAYLLYGLSIADDPLDKLFFPVSLDQNTRAKVINTRSSQFTDIPAEMFSEASSLFVKAQTLDPSYMPAKINNFISDYILVYLNTDNSQSLRKAYLEKNKILPNKVLNDMFVIDMILNKKPRRVIQKLAKNGTLISQKNTSNTNEVEEVDYDLILEKLGISIIDLVLLNSDAVNNSKLKQFQLDQYKIFNIDDTYVIGLEREELDKFSLSDLEENIIIKTGNGYYLVFSI